ncbi:MAG TPA: hypothetical protein VJT33_15550 [bacterium]|nr:hypothetical protein [bacterium]
MVVRMMVLRPTDIDVNMLRRNGTAAVTVHPDHLRVAEEGAPVAYTVSADFLPAGSDVRTFRSLETAMGFAVGLVMSVEEVMRKLLVQPVTIEIQVEV